MNKNELKKLNDLIIKYRDLADYFHSLYLEDYSARYYSYYLIYSTCRDDLDGLQL